jgi:hypothetical protein
MDSQGRRAADVPARLGELASELRELAEAVPSTEGFQSDRYEELLEAWASLQSAYDLFAAEVQLS